MGHVMSHTHAAEVTLHVAPILPALRRYARTLVRNREMADDLVQDCLERVVRRWNQRRSEQSTRSWMFAIAHKPGCQPAEATDAAWPAPRHRGYRRVGNSPASQPEDRIRHGELMRALQALPADQRAAVVLVCVDGLSYAQAAMELNVPIGTVMSRLGRARAKLQGALN
jgi:RNA polymerase sigma-70 factor (ECF subfamily)